MDKEYIKDIPNWEKDYLSMARNDLSKQQIHFHFVFYILSNIISQVENHPSKD